MSADISVGDVVAVTYEPSDGSFSPLTTQMIRVTAVDDSGFVGRWAETMHMVRTDDPYTDPRLLSRPINAVETFTPTGVVQSIEEVHDPNYVGGDDDPGAPGIPDVYADTDMTVTDMRGRTYNLDPEKVKARRAAEELHRTTQFDERRKDYLLFESDPPECWCDGRLVRSPDAGEWVCIDCGLKVPTLPAEGEEVA